MDTESETVGESAGEGTDQPVHSITTKIDDVLSDLSVLVKLARATYVKMGLLKVDSEADAGADAAMADVSDVVKSALQ